MGEFGPRLAPGGEFDLIRGFFRQGVPAPRPDVPVGPGDDAAVVAGEGVALSSDMSVEGIHFRREWLGPQEIGFRAAAGALSDLAGMAARPIGVLASLALPASDAGEAATLLMDGIREAAETVGAIVLGGDLTRSPGPLVVDVTVAGECPAPVLRSGAREGDEVWVTGALGGAAAAVALWTRGVEPPPALRERFARPAPRCREALWLAARGVLGGMLDLSDGVAGDAGHISAASGVAVLLDPQAIPVHPGVPDAGFSTEAALRLAVSGGEDYELCFTAPPGATSAEEFRRAFGVGLTRIGRVERGEGVWWSDPEGGRTPIAAGGFQHFGRGA